MDLGPLIDQREGEDATSPASSAPESMSSTSSNTSPPVESTALPHRTDAQLRVVVRLADQTINERLQILHPEPDAPTDVHRYELTRPISSYGTAARQSLWSTDEAMSLGAGRLRS